jgi:hypothetical protein
LSRPGAKRLELALARAAEPARKTNRPHDDDLELGYDSGRVAAQVTGYRLGARLVRWSVSRNSEGRPPDATEIASTGPRIGRVLRRARAVDSREDS